MLGEILQQVSYTSGDLFSGFLCVSLTYATTLALHLVLPGRWTEGYVCDRNGKPLRYHLNGFSVLLCTWAAWFISIYLLETPLFRATFWFENFATSAVVANLVGLLFSLAYFVKGQTLSKELLEPYTRCPTVDKPEKPKTTQKDLDTFLGEHPVIRFYLGYEFNPQYGTVDVKVLLYLLGVVMLSLNLFSAAAKQIEIDGELSQAMKAYMFCMLWFCVDYILGEYIHLYTYDFLAERIGFKLGWGCLCFYPFSYALPVLPIVFHMPNADLSQAQALGVVALYLFGWVLTRGSNLQKFYFKTDPKRKTVLFGLIQQRTIPESRILCSGFWGVARHVNYLGETLQAVAVAYPGFAVSGSLLPFVYPIYYALLFIFRQRSDEEICAAKYGAKWDQYIKAVPSRIIPYVY